LRISGRTRDEVREALAEAQGSVKLAVMLLHGCEAAEATALLDRAGGQLRAALELMEAHGEDVA
jgi:N-acetylmuramic acid 6-phosphate etherase